MQRKLLTAFVALMMLSALPLSVSADENEDIPTNAAATGIHDSLVAALAHADLVGALSGSGPFTVFAPTDQAFADAGIDLASFDTDAENATLVDILTYHVVTGSVMSTDLSDGLTTDALNGDKLSFGVGEEVKVNDAVVIQADVTASNGVIHVIDKVLMPPVDVYVSDGSMASPYFQFYTDSAGENSMSEIDISKNYKFQRLNNPSAHPFYIGDNGYNADSSSNMIIAGDGSSSSGISDDQTFTVFFRDGFTTDDALSYFCTVHSNMIDTFTLTAPVAAQDITEIASSTGVHDSLVAALAKANLVSALQADGPFTVFAPTDQAFTDAGIDLDTFNDDESIAALADILTYHVYVGAVESSAVTDGLTVTMLNGDDASFTVADGVVSIEGATVTTADVIASNGVIHVIDKVLMPPADTPDEPANDIPAIASGTGVHTALVAALAKANLVSALQADGPFTVFAPTDQAFTDAGIDLDTFNDDESIAALADILTYHVYVGAVESSAVTDGLTVTMLNGDDASFTVADGVVSIEGATVTTADVIASNGVIHVIDKVLMPPADLVDITAVAMSTGVHETLVAALVKADMVSNLQTPGPFTVFAPTDQAFADAGIDLDTFTTADEIGVLTDILLYHVYNGAVESSAVTDGLTVEMLNGDSASFTVADGVVSVEGATVTTADVMASNGVVHVIDKVLMPPADVVDETDDVTCDVTIGISSDGYGFSPAAVTIDVGQTVCWQWTDAGMGHNVKEVDGMKSTTYVDGGVYSGTAATTVDFHHTFTEDTIFYYACEPHISMDMFGKVTVGDGGVEPAYTDKEDKEDNNTPGFLGVTVILATLGAVLFARMRQEDEL